MLVRQLFACSLAQAIWFIHVTKQSHNVTVVYTHSTLPYHSINRDVFLYCYLTNECKTTHKLMFKAVNCAPLRSNYSCVSNVHFNNVLC